MNNQEIVGFMKTIDEYCFDTRIFKLIIVMSNGISYKFNQTHDLMIYCDCLQINWWDQCEIRDGTQITTNKKQYIPLSSIESWSIDIIFEE